MSVRLDGRHLRSERSRTAIVEALLSLVRTGGALPSSADIARCAGVTQRTLFNQFEDVSSLLAAVIERQIAHVHALLPRVSTHGTVDERVAAWVDALAPFLDEIAAVRWAVLSRDDPQVHAGLRRVRGLVRRRLSVSFAAELRKLDGRRRATLLDAVECATDPITWRGIRTSQGRSVEQAAAVVKLTMLALARSAKRA